MHEKLAWAFLGLCAGMAAPALAVLIFLAAGLSDWSPLTPAVAKCLALIASGILISCVSCAAYRYSRAALFSVLASAAGVALAVKTGLLVSSPLSYI